MFGMLELISKFISQISNQFVFRDIEDVDKARVNYSYMSDEVLREECRLASRSADTVMEEPKRNFFRTLVAMIASFFRPDRTIIVQHVALGVEAFTRVPADLPPGSLLYKQQVEAALALTQRCIIQMDTGEGKTYALLPAGFALACEHYRTYIICPNEYLAWRDARRTRNYWEFVGLSVGLFLKDSATSELSHRIVYTTAKQLIFHHLGNVISTTRPQHSLSGAILIDEADAILLDEGSEKFSLARSIRAEAYDWAFAIEFAHSLVEEEEIIANRSTLDANLTIAGETKLKAAWEGQAGRPTPYLLLRAAVEIAFVAVSLVNEDVHYIIEDKAYPVDLVTGKIDRNRTPSWIIPLEFLRGFSPRPELLTLDQITPFSFLQKFPHVSGLSGTIQDDFAEYFFFHFFMPIVIEPRFKRQEGLQLDVISRTQDAAVRNLVQDVKEKVNQRRPVLIGTQTITEAEMIYKSLQTALLSSVRLNLLTAKNDRDAAAFYETAGEVGSVLVATQLSGRGVDIRLSQEARENGGMALIGFGHALEVRYDRQFLGRAGRQGDPYTAQFFCSLEDSLMKEFTGERVKLIMERLGMEDDVVIESKMVSKRLVAAQFNRRKYGYINRLNQVGLEILNDEVRNSIENWFNYLQIPVESESLDSKSYLGADLDEAHCSQAFVDEVIEDYLGNHLQPVIADLKEVGLKEADQIVTLLKNSLGNEIIKPIELEGSIQTVTEKIRKRLREKLNELFRQYDTACAAAEMECNALHAKYIQLEGEWERQAPDPGEDFPFDLEGANDLLLEETLDEDWIDEESGEEEADEEIFEEDEEDEELIENDRLDDDVEEGDGDELDPNNSLATLSDNVARKFELLPRKIPSPEMEEARMAWEKAWQQWSQLIARSPKKIAFWSILTNWMSYLEEQERIIQRSYLKGLSFYDRHRIVNDQLLVEWQTKEAQISPFVLENLLKCRQPETLNTLFYYDDNQAEDYRRQDNLLNFDWTSSAPQLDPAYNPQDVAEALATHFFKQYREEIGGDYYNPESLKDLLYTFLCRHPVYTLQSPDRIQQALETFPLLQGVDRPTKKLRQYWMRKFLIFLRERSQIGPLPVFRDRVKSFFNHFKRRASDLKSILTFSGLTVFTVVFGLASYFGNFAEPKELGVLGQQLDLLLFGGFLSKGIFTAPAMSALALAAAGWFIIKPEASNVVQGAGPDRLLAVTFQAIFAVWITDWNLGPSPVFGALHSVFLLLVTFAFAHVTQVVTWSSQNTSGVSLTTGWLCYTSMLAYAPALVGSLFTPSVPLFCLLLGLIIHGLLGTLNICEVPLISSRIRKSAASMDAEDISGCLRVNGNCGALPHIYGAVFCWLIYETWEIASQKLQWKFDLVTLELSLLVLYLLITQGLIALIVSKRFSLNLWEARLNTNHQAIAGAQTKESREKILRQLKSRLMWREIAIQSALILALSYSLKSLAIPNSLFPLGLTLVFVSALAMDQVIEFCGQLYAFLLRRAPDTREILDLSRLKEPREKEDPFYRLKYILKFRISWTLTIVGGVWGIVNVILKAKELFPSLRSWVHSALRFIGLS
jgi:preprotein translocase subunit SecA